jgi:hypothetical protein
VGQYGSHLLRNFIAQVLMFFIAAVPYSLVGINGKGRFLGLTGVANVVKDIKFILGTILISSAIPVEAIYSSLYWL